MIFGTVEKWGDDGHALKGKGTGIEEAIKAGFDTFDTAPVYLNEKEVGNDLEGIFQVQSKLDYFKWGYENVIEEFENSSEHLSITTYLIHWPVLPLKELKETWRAFEHLKNEGQVEKIGVCNFTIKHLQKRQDYLFKKTNGYSPIVKANIINSSFSLGKSREKINFDTITVKHGKTTCLAYIFEKTAYISDSNDLSIAKFDATAPE